MMEISKHASIGFSCLTRANLGFTSVESIGTMVLAWYRDAVEENHDQPHKTSPPQYVDIETLNKTTHMLYWKLDADNYLKEGKFQKIREERFYDYEDVCEMHPDKMPKLEEWKKTFYREHLHTDEEIRFILDGSGYWDVRDENDRWIRVMGEKGDLIVVPAGMYHRFCLDEKNYIKAIRLFQGSPDWTAFFRPADDHPARIAYLKRLSKK